MRFGVILAFFSVTVLPDRSIPAAVDETEKQEKGGQILSFKNRLAFEKYYVNEGKPTVPEYACAHEMSAYRALNAAQSPCLQGYARHSNGRCYRVVDKPQDGGVVSKHEYRITFRATCQTDGWERKALYLSRSKTLDFCDEDGGCVNVREMEDVKTTSGGRMCADGQSPDGCQTRLVFPALPGWKEAKKGGI